MDSDVKQELTKSDFLNADEAGKITPVTPMSDSNVSDSNEQWKAVLNNLNGFISDVPAYLGEFFSEYKRPIVTVGLFVTAIIAVKLTLAVLDAVNDIPLLEPTFELIGLGYSIWFIYRYLLRANNRKELAEDFNTLKDQVLGQASKLQ